MELPRIVRSIRPFVSSRESFARSLLPSLTLAVLAAACSCGDPAVASGGDAGPDVGDAGPGADGGRLPAQDASVGPDGCAPRACAPSECGARPDGCGGELACGACTFSCRGDTTPRSLGRVSMERAWYGQAVVDGADLYVVRTLPGAGPTGIHRVSLSPGGPTPEQVVDDAVFDVAIADGSIYFTTVDLVSNNRLLRQPVAGGLPTAIATGISSNIQVEGAEVLAFREGRFGAFSTVDGSFAPRLDTTEPTSRWVREGDALFWATNLPDGTFDVRRAPIAGGDVETIAVVPPLDPLSPSYRTGFTVFKGYVYWTDGPFARLRRVPTAGGEPETVWTSPGYTSAVVVGGAELFVSVGWHPEAPAPEAERGIWAIDPRTGARRRVLGPFPGDDDSAGMHPLAVVGDGCLLLQHAPEERSSASLWELYVLEL
ncbi:MAG TPA: hypothetical protein RMH99_23170 [Sandaracinaceae bacterium LLY-WYZ-13_1]|nr:hypothetical protein [Sandaracinaceae bacterium LLY-WYZ-13_1]